MIDSVFIDTNILVYSCDNARPDIQLKARNCLRELTRTGRGVISTQVMQEFFVAATRKLGIEPLLAKGILRTFAQFRIVCVTGEMIMDAIDCASVNQISFWDSLILTSAAQARCFELWSEDLNAGQSIGGVKIRNPLI